MIPFLFKYPISVFSKGRFLFLGTAPRWLLVVLILVAAAALALLIRRQLPRAAPKLRGWRAGVIWALQSSLVAILLLLLWRPAISVSELTSQQNIIAVLVDDSRSMGIHDSGSDGRATREEAAVRAMREGVLAGLQKRFQTRIYRLDRGVAQIPKLDDVTPTGPATHIDGGLRQFTSETADLPVGAVVLLSDGAENSGGDAGGIEQQTLNALRNRRLPVHTIGFGREQAQRDAELDDVSLAPRSVADARMTAKVSFHQKGYSGKKAELTVSDAGKTLVSREVTLRQDGTLQTETIFFSAGSAGAKSFRFELKALPGEENLQNNALMRPVSVSDQKRRILYVEGEPRWEYKFIRRAEDDDHTVEIVSMLRTTENKIYRQGISNPSELQEGFPTRPEDLFGYQGIILGSVEAGYFTPSQQELLREFVNRRGGGVLFLGGRFSLADGGWASSGAAELFPTFLPNGRNTFHRDPATAELTAAGADSPITRLVDDPAKNVDRWKKLTYLMDYQDPGTPKPGATVLAQMNAGTRKLPLLVTEAYGRGRTAELATSGTWRWQMSQPLGDPAHDLFWQQLLRWLVADTPGPVVASTSAQTLMDDGTIRISAAVRDKQFQPAPDARVAAHILGPEGTSAMVDLSPVAGHPGEFSADWTADRSGSYLAEVSAEHGGGDKGRGAEELGRDVLTFQRTDGVAENFHTEQNREMLEKLATDTGGRYWKPDELSRLPDEISLSEAGISVRDTKELWNMPAVFFLLLALLSAEWLLRRKWGIV